MSQKPTLNANGADMPGSNAKKVGERKATEIAVSGFVGILKDKTILFRQILSGVRILVLSCNEELRMDVRDSMRRDGYKSTFVIDEAKKMFPSMPELEVETEAFAWVDIIIAIEDRQAKNARRCPGFVQECTVIMLIPKYQGKTIYICSSSIPKKTIRNVTKLHYLYFPNIEQINYNRPHRKLVEEIVLIAKKEAHRIAYGAVRVRKGGSNIYLPPNINEELK